MKAIVIFAPYAPLAVLGIKTIETKTAPPAGDMKPEGVQPSPGCAINAGERVAVVLGKRVNRYEDCPEAWDRLADALPTNELGPGLAEAFAKGWVGHLGYKLGAVIGTVVVSEALPMVAERECDGYPAPAAGMLTVSGPACPVPTLLRFRWSRNAWALAPALYAQKDGLSPQLPLGEFAPGRWGWMLTDPQPCDPIPVVGKQGVFRLPEDVAAQLSAREDNPR